MPMRKILLAVLVLLHTIGWGQKGKIENSYHAVKSKGSDNASLVVDNVAGLNKKDWVMIIQMKGGVTMSTKNDPTFGDVTEYSNVGNYELATICDIDAAANTIHFSNVLSRTYDFGGKQGNRTLEMGKIQVVRIPVYESFTVTSLSEPLPWDSATGKGGVLAIIADDLILGANISANGKGFVGGKYQDSDDGCSVFGHTGFIYNPTSNPQNGAYKGESIFNIAISQGGGKGANANGGGGGNNHNNGGGGGANLSRGGTGAGNYSVPDNLVGCINADPGIGGKEITIGSKDRIFLGGGGGAGQLNDALAPQIGGGAGGGIIFIQARNLSSNSVLEGTPGGFTISANGLKGGDQQGDGAAGGGAGGTIIMDVANYLGTNSINLQSEGGKGGSVNNENISGNCYGEGGGGSGGVIYFKYSKPSLVNASIAGGLKGSKDATRGCRSSLTTAQDGSPGVVTGNYARIPTGAPNNDCPVDVILPVRLLYFTVTNKGAQATAEWKVEKPEDAAHYVLQRKDNNGPWKDAHIIPGDAQLTTYQKGDGPLATGVYLYRLKIVEKDGSIHYSSVQSVSIKNEDINRLTIHPNPATSQVTIVTPSGHDEWLHIYDMKSRLVYKKKIAPNDTIIRQDISFLAEGVYMIQVGKLTARFVVFQ